MIKEEIRSLVKDSLKKLDKTNKYHDRFLDAEIEKVLNEMYWELFAVDPLILQRYTKTYTVVAPAATLEATTGLYYSALPAAIVPFPDKCSGVRRISTMIQGGMKFYPMDAREMDLMTSSSYVSYVSSKIGYAVNGRIEYYKMTAAQALLGLRMDLIIPFSVYSDTDTVLLPEIRGQEGNSFLDRVLAKLLVIPPVDLKDTNKDETNNNK